MTPRTRTLSLSGCRSIADCLARIRPFAEQGLRDRLREERRELLTNANLDDDTRWGRQVALEHNEAHLQELIDEYMVHAERDLRIITTEGVRNG